MLGWLVLLAAPVLLACGTSSTDGPSLGSLPGDEGDANTVEAANPDGCAPQCQGRACGPDGCGGVCGICIGSLKCNAGACTFCVPSCTGKPCGPDGCGGQCGTCATGQTCDTAGHCVTPPDCGQVTKVGCCDHQALWTCPAGTAVTTDCTSQPKCGWDATSGGYACGTSGTAAPGAGYPMACPWVCKPACDVKVCGDDGCGGSCGTCPSGVCLTTTGACCQPACDGKSCGADGCGGSCGGCDVGVPCVGGKCATDLCAGKTCGVNAVGGSCGHCAPGETCTDAGQCVATCTPDCQGKACGPDGCGKQCTPGCTAGLFCDDAGHCGTTCTPQCSGKACGDDGCGKSCGSCPGGLGCTLGGVCGSGCETCPADPQCLSLGFESGNLLGWYTTGTPMVVPSLGAAIPPEGKHMAQLPNLPGNSSLSFTTCVPAGTSTLRFAWKFYSEEFHEWCGSQFQDHFDVAVTAADTGKTATFAVTVNDLCCASDGTGCGTYWHGHSCGLSPSDVEFDQGDAHMTGWQVAHLDLTPALAGQQAVVTVSFSIKNGGDTIYETLVLLDDVEFLKGCNPTCGTALCGDDGCGGACGLCGTGTCSGGQCSCAPSCYGKVCGDDGCGGSCGTCGTGHVCMSGNCASCTPACAGVQCGDDGCGGSCGKCSPPATCIYGACCTPTCVGKQCGNDGCGGSCGNCTTGYCAVNTCVCTPSCGGNACGADGCGGTCGTCAPPATCVAGSCCTPSCLGKQCGTDGCGGSCGGCGLLDSCQQGKCVGGQACPNPPASWAPVIATVATLLTPGDAATVVGSCSDYSGDGKGDNGLKALASTANPELSKAVAGGSFVALFEFKGVTDFYNSGPFTLNGLTGVPQAAGSIAYLVDPVSYDGTCAAVDHFAAVISSGKLTGTATAMTVGAAANVSSSAPFMLVMHMTNVMLRAQVVDSKGTMTNGFVSGVWSKVEMDAMVASSEAQCQADPTASVCNYIGTMKSFLPMLLDLDLDKDGVKDAASICMQFTTVPASIAGMKP